MAASDFDRHVHWDNVYRTKGERDVSWFQDSPQISLDLIGATGAQRDAAIVDIGGGASRLVDALLAQGYDNLTVLDISEQALATSKARLGAQSSRVMWVAADVTEWQPDRSFDVWHDRAVFHFLTDPADRVSYVARLSRAVRPGGHAVIGTFALDGPERCSGLPVVRYDAASLGAVLGPSFQLVQSRGDAHRTPWHTIQSFQFSLFKRLP